MSDSPKEPPNITYENDNPGDERPLFRDLLSYLLRDWPMAKRVIDLEIEKNKELTTFITGTVERQYMKSA